jgi:hypothetical protein
MISHERDLHVVELHAVVTRVTLFVSRTPLRSLSHRGFGGNLGAIFGADRGSLFAGMGHISASSG